MDNEQMDQDLHERYCDGRNDGLNDVIKLLQNKILTTKDQLTLSILQEILACILLEFTVTNDPRR